MSNINFPQAYVGCGLGIGTIGFTMVTFGVSSTVSCIMLGRLERPMGRVALLTGAGLTDTGLLVTLLLWQPQGGCVWLFYVIPALWGVAEGVWTSTMTCG